ncbi:MAG: ATP synthase F0 subunit A [Candidatus Doudnabacteria bacterium RIFCSPHIGHO2_01_FULL_46_24]|uniref:ATP synthase subunit a n=1 Tax=Candidatus Doudnabacteria bacterium RIFCSPHIGHO2_01_FULL_46_24 TaxID=1817825 RepID=A0A1F5NTW0_9BACT|nr:MAG: ATP synthase F0 subunit A [Candidatus Doudnabacteria bacterium RIFCSPHIGHO2_01_FULL_46_24]
MTMTITAAYALPPLVAEPIFHIGSFPVTNAYINSVIAVLLFLVAGFLLRKKTAMIPKGFQNAAEGVLEFMLGYVDRVTQDRKKSLKFLPIVGGLFLFILVSNWMGFIPGTGSIGRYLLVHGERELVPLFRPANSDLNMTLAMAVFSVITSHILGVAAIGFFRYANKFVKLGDLYHSLRKGGISIMVAVFEFGVGIIEIFSEVAKMVSLSLRLFGNIFAGEVLLTVIAGLIAYFVPLPFMLLELIVGLVQATVFAMLTLVYLTMATAELPQEAHH